MDSVQTLSSLLFAGRPPFSVTQPDSFYNKDRPMPASAWATQIHPARLQPYRTIIGTSFLTSSRSKVILFSFDYTMNIACYRRLLEFLRSTTHKITANPLANLMGQKGDKKAPAVTETGPEEYRSRLQISRLLISGASQASVVYCESRRRSAIYSTQEST